MKNILLVEDDPFLVDIYTTKFKEAGFQVETVSDGNEAMNKLKEAKPDLLVLDIVLPQSDGWEVLRQIREDKDLRHLKVAILSNLSQKAEVNKALALGAVRYLIKAHYTPSEIVKEIRKILS
jgi:two-component system alkaline phosphatase synthesis response regulator PhoP